VQIQPRDHTLTDVEIEALADAVVTAVSKAGGRLRS
jgi:phenylalanyl-tRNA synthetase beta subunit